MLYDYLEEMILYEFPTMTYSEILKFMRKLSVYEHKVLREVLIIYAIKDLCKED